MARGLFCISVSDLSASNFLRKAAEACAKASAVELRFDGLEPSELSKAVEGLADLRSNYDGILIGTLRSSGDGQGGFRKVSSYEIEAFWSDPRLKASIDRVDAGPDELPDPPPEYKQIIRSFHSFEGVPEEVELATIRTKLLSAGSDPSRNIAKIACTPSDIAESLPVWRMLEGSGDTIPIAMGEFGIWTRVLGPAFGSAIGYSSPAEGPESAPGQVPSDDLTKVYRADSITEATGIYGIAGLPVSHSLSPFIHNAAFQEVSIDSVYLPLAVRDVSEFYRTMVSSDTRSIEWNLRGFSVTHPHKTEIARLVDRLEADAQAIGAVNTVKIENGSTVGSNTDAEGFLAALRSKIGDPEGASVGIIGSGGAARAAIFALSKARARTVVFSRDTAKATPALQRFGAAVRLLDREPASFKGLDVLVNASPVGSSGELADISPVPVESLKNLQLAFDIVYNPIRTRFLRDAEEAGIPTIGGLEMLIEQAALQFRIWTGREAPKNVMRKAAESRIRSL
ncbi:MAG TPA: shikimate dehydrogenase [Aridibacter sp.]|nr:shikimate dehydrogenase [Aridibacter sp.]